MNSPDPHGEHTCTPGTEILKYPPHPPPPTFRPDQRFTCVPPERSYPSYPGPQTTPNEIQIKIKRRRRNELEREKPQLNRASLVYGPAEADTEERGELRERPLLLYARQLTGELTPPLARNS